MTQPKAPPRPANIRDAGAMAMANMQPPADDPGGAIDSEGAGDTGDVPTCPECNQPVNNCPQCGGSMAGAGGGMPGGGGPMPGGKPIV